MDTTEDNTDRHDAMSEPNDLEERKNELFATMTLIKAAKRDLVVVQAAGGDQLPLIDRLADLESQRERLAHEVNSQYMYRNLQTFMSRVDAYDAARAAEAATQTEQIGGLGDGQANLQAEFRTGLSGIQETVSALAETVDGLQTQMRESQEDRQALHAEIVAVKAQAAERMAKIEQRDRDDIRTEIKSTNLEIASMKDMLSRYDSQLRELVDRLEARGGDAKQTDEPDG